MRFQFLCPQGHLLEAEESEVGQQGKCPYCDTLFLVPQANRAPPGTMRSMVGCSPPVDPSAAGPPAPPDAGYSAPPFQQPQQTAGNSSRHMASAVYSGVQSFPGSTQPDIVHIPCPKGHELETPRQMLGQHAMCPYCQVQFRLRFEDSVEYQRQKAQELERKERRMGRLWLQWSITAAVMVVLGLILLILLSS